MKNSKVITERDAVKLLKKDGEPYKSCSHYAKCLKNAHGKGVPVGIMMNAKKCLACDDYEAPKPVKGKPLSKKRALEILTIDGELSKQKMSLLLGNDKDTMISNLRYLSEHLHSIADMMSGKKVNTLN